MTNELQEAFDQQVAAEPDAPASGDFLKRLKEFTLLELERRALEENLECTQKRILALKPQLLEDMAEAGVESAHCNGLSVFTRIDRYVSKKKEVETEQVCRVLEQIGRGDMVNDGYNASSLKALIGEWMTEGQEVPPVLAGLLNIGSVVNLVTRK